MSRIIGVALLIGVWAGLGGQTTERLRFEVAAIKSNESGRPNFLFQGLGTNRFTAVNASVQELVVMAYHVYNHQVTGGPAWMGSERFDIAAKAPVQADLRQMEEMMQSLLEERFKLRFHREMRETRVLDLVVGKNGPKLGEPDDKQADRAFSGGIDAHHAGLNYLASALSYRIGINVVNQTGIEGRFSYRLKWTPDEMHPAPGDKEPVSLYTAIQEQLGLKLESRKGQVEFVAIDSVARPTEN
jgi:uncharacterized protein (TIGR03435 family)